MKQKVLVTRIIPGSAVENMKERFRVILGPGNRNLTYEEMLGMAEDCSGVLTMLSDRVDENFMELNPGLQVISNYAVGYHHIDLAAAHRRGIVVTNTPGVLTETTADLTWALIMAVARRVAEADRFTREGRFEGWEPEMFLGGDVHGKTLGIVGLGRIGQATARRALGFGMRIIYYSRSRKPEVENSLGATFTDLDTLVSEADIISLHTPLAPETRHLINARRLSLAKPTAYLINTSRGPVVDEQALVRALRSGKIAGAGLDVYENEPELQPGLAGLPNTVLLPHIGSASVETRSRMAQIAVDNLTAVLDGRRPLHPVEPPA